MVKLALYIGKGKVGNHLIRWWTNRQESHCELVVDGWSYSSSLMDGGVRKKLIEFNPSHWYFIDTPWVTESKVLNHYEKTKHKHYSLKGLITSQIFNRNVDDVYADFCSEWCADALGLPNARIYNPATLADLCHFLKTKGYFTNKGAEHDY